MFIAEVLNVRADESLIDPADGAFHLERAGLMSYSHGAYFSQGEMLGKFGWSVAKTKAGVSRTHGAASGQTLKKNS